MNKKQSFYEQALEEVDLDNIPVIQEETNLVKVKEKSLEKITEEKSISNLKVVGSLRKDISKLILEGFKLVYALPTFVREDIEKDKKDGSYSGGDIGEGVLYLITITEILHSTAYYFLIDNRNWYGYFIPLGTGAISGAYEIFRHRKSKLEKNKITQLKDGTK